jgi:hypothetical protein
MTKQETQLITGKVAGVINERELTINIGSDQGVYKGMTFKVLSDKPLEVSDPDSGKLLGEVDREKVRVTASEVHPKFSICRTYRTRTVGGGIFALTRLTDPPREVAETLRADDSAYYPPLSEEESFVKKGDRVIEIKP